MSITKALNGPIGPKNIRTYVGPPGTSYGTAVKQGAADGAALAVTGAGQKCLGIVESTDLDNTGFLPVVVWGETLGIAGAAVPADSELIVDANGNLIPSTAQGDYVIGRARSSAAAAQQEIVVFVSPYIR